MLTVILMVHADEFELPVYCADDAHELYEEYGIPVSSIWDCIKYDRVYKFKYKFYKVEIDED